MAFTVVSPFAPRAINLFLNRTSRRNNPRFDKIVAAAKAASK
jgi:hypothetical protein